MHVFRPLNLLNFAEQQQVAEDAENENDGGNDEVQRERTSSVNDNTGYDWGNDARAFFCRSKKGLQYPSEDALLVSHSLPVVLVVRHPVLA